MSTTTFILIALLILLSMLLAYLVHRKVPKKLKSDRFINDWKELQALCKHKESWPNAILEADKLLDKALKTRRFKGKRMGERMVAAQRSISNNDQLWFAHNLSKKIIADPNLKLKESDVKMALIGFRQALKDLGALQNSEQAVVTDGKQNDK